MDCNSGCLFPEALFCALPLPFTPPYLEGMVWWASVLLFKLARKWRKRISLTGSLRWPSASATIDKLDEACTNGDDRMMLVQHSSGDRVMS